MSYEWSWQQRGRSHLPEADSQFDQQHQLPSPPTWEVRLVLGVDTWCAVVERVDNSRDAEHACGGLRPLADLHSCHTHNNA